MYYFVRYHKDVLRKQRGKREGRKIKGMLWLRYHTIFGLNLLSSGIGCLIL
jgi:hypothetical protein